MTGIHLLWHQLPTKISEEQRQRSPTQSLLRWDPCLRVTRLTGAQGQHTWTEGSTRYSARWSQVELSLF